MITVLQKKGKKVVELKLEELKKQAIRTNAAVWIDAQNPTGEELHALSDILGFPYSELREHTTKYERPRRFEFEKYSMLVLAVPINEKGITRTSVSFFIHPKNNILTIRTRPVEAIEYLKKELLEKETDYIESPVKLLCRLMERIVDDYFQQQDEFQEVADNIETAVLHKPDNTHIEQLFKLKKQLLFSHKALVANREVIRDVENGRIAKLTTKEVYEFRDVYNDVVQLIDANETLRDIVTGVIDIYISSISNQLNKVMKKLTVMASYVLIPTLIASIYGMNFRFMPEIPWKWGYPFSIGLMIFSILVMYIYFKKVKWL